MRYHRAGRREQGAGAVQQYSSTAVQQKEGAVQQYSSTAVQQYSRRIPPAVLPTAHCRTILSPTAHCPLPTAHYSRGFALLVAIIVASVALAIGASLASIAYKQVLLSSSASDSQSAFYAADSGLECALYFDQQSNAFDYTTPFAAITCGGQSLALTPVSRTSATSTMTFHWPIDGGATCADVTVAKNQNGQTALYAVGHNTCDTTNPRLIERGLEAFY